MERLGMLRHDHDRHTALRRGGWLLAACLSAAGCTPGDGDAAGNSPPDDISSRTARAVVTVAARGTAAGEALHVHGGRLYWLDADHTALLTIDGAATAAQPRVFATSASRIADFVVTDRGVFYTTQVASSSGMFGKVVWLDASRGDAYTELHVDPPESGARLRRIAADEESGDIYFVREQYDALADRARSAVWRVAPGVDATELAATVVNNQILELLTCGASGLVYTEFGDHIGAYTPGTALWSVRYDGSDVQHDQPGGGGVVRLACARGVTFWATLFGGGEAVGRWQPGDSIGTFTIVGQDGAADALAVDATQVFWANRLGQIFAADTSNSATARVIAQSPRTPGTYPDHAPPTSIAVDDANVYWSTAEAIYRLPRSAF